MVFGYDGTLLPLWEEMVNLLYALYSGVVWPDLRLPDDYMKHECDYENWYEIGDMVVIHSDTMQIEKEDGTRFPGVLCMVFIPLKFSCKKK